MDPLAHASIALLAKPAVPKALLLALIAATQVPDLMSFAFIAVSIEHVAETRMDFSHWLQYISLPLIPWSHGMVMCCLWSVLVEGIRYPLFRDRRVSIALGLMVMNHWLLDFIVYPVQPLLFRRQPYFGLGLITSRPGLIVGIILEFVLIFGGIVVYLATRKRTHGQALG